MFEELCHANISWRRNDLLYICDSTLTDWQGFASMTVFDAIEKYGNYEVVWFKGDYVGLFSPSLFIEGD